MPATKRHMSINLRWLTWRARLSIPSLLATREERQVISLISGVNVALAILTISLLAWFTGLPLVFPALGPTAFILFSKPFSPDAAPRSVIFGHFSGIASGIVAWHLFSYLGNEPVSLDTLGWATFASTSAALAITCFLMVRFSCPHAPACASALIVALGGATGWLNLVAMAIAVVVLSGQALLIYRIGGVKTPSWAPAR
jgi:CBS domain-containing membrane protein